MAELLRSGVGTERLILSARRRGPASRSFPHVPDVRRADYDDPASLRAAFRNTDLLVLIPTLAPVEERLHQHDNALRAAAENGVGRVVFSSFQAVGARSRFSRAAFYREGESRLRESVPAWTIVRSGLHLEFLGVHLRGAMERGVLSVPAPHGRVAAVSRDDIARGLAAVCLGEDHAGEIYGITGVRAVSMREVAATASRIAGREMAFLPCDRDRYTASLGSRGVPEPAIEAWTSTWEAVEAGELERVSGDLQRLTGRGAPSLPDQLRPLLGPEGQGAA